MDRAGEDENFELFQAITPELYVLMYSGQHNRTRVVVAPSL